MKLLLPVLSIIVIVFAVFWMFGTNQLYNYGVDQGMNTGNTSSLFSLWEQMIQLPNYIWYGVALICILLGIVTIFKSVT